MGGAINREERGVGTEECLLSGSFPQELEGGRGNKRGGIKGCMERPRKESWVRWFGSRVVGWKSVLVGIFGSWSSWWPVCGEAVRGATRSSELAVGGESGRGTRDADWRCRSAGCVARTCASGWRATERARPPRGRPESAAAILVAVATEFATRPSRHHEGAGYLQRSRGALSVTKAPRYKGPRNSSDSLVCEGVFAFFSFE